MDVFKISPTAAYSGGAACVAANNKEEAINTFCENDYRKFNYEVCYCTCDRIPKMSYDIDRPSIIFDDLYLE